MNRQSALLHGVFIAAIGLWLAVNASAQLQFTSISNTPEGTIQLKWASISKETYEIDEADTLETNAQGSLTWNELYKEYPSQGSSTFWLDTGNYISVPPILNPKYTTNRFYRVVDLGPDTTSDEPTVSITSPASGSTVSGSLTITVAASTDQTSLSTLLYVDGQEMPVSAGGSNYVINTCEWLNGQHILFATARCTSAPEGGDNSPAVLVGHAVSAFVPVTFNNLVTGITFSQPFFDPTLGQTQLVTAVFASNSDWTLTIINAASNTVRTATGSGTTMAFNWDGTGTGEISLPAGVYNYLISAYTNGLGSGGSGTNGGGNGEPPPPGGDEVSPGSPASVSGTGMETVQLPPAPVPFFYGRNADGTEITTMEVPVPDNTIDESALLAGGIHPDGAPSAPSSQSAPAAPVRPPTAPVRGTVGTFGVAYQSYIENGAAGYTLGDPLNCEIGGVIKIEGFPTDENNNFPPLPSYGPQARNFIAAMKQGGWNASFVTADNQVRSTTITGSASPFNQVNLGLLMLHGVYGATADYCYNGCKQMYFPLGNLYGSASWINMGDMNFGGTPTNGLEWMAIEACFSLYQPNWTSMQSANIKPYNSNLHLLLGVNTTSFTDRNREALWAQYMQFGKTPGSPMTIQAAWYQAARDGFQLSKFSYDGTISYAVAGDANCSGDYLLTNSPPTGTQFYFSQQIYP